MNNLGEHEQDPTARRMGMKTPDHPSLNSFWLCPAQTFGCDTNV